RDHGRRLHQLPQVPRGGDQAEAEEDQRVRRSVADAGHRTGAGHWLRQGIEDRSLCYGQRLDAQSGGVTAGLCHRGRVRPDRRPQKDGECVWSCGRLTRTLPEPLVIYDRQLMNGQDRAKLVLSFAQVPHVNGQSTKKTVEAAERLSNTLGLHAEIIPRWGELQLHARNQNAELVSVTAADPIGVDMARVVSPLRAAEDLDAGLLAPSALRTALPTTSPTPPAPPWR